MTIECVPITEADLERWAQIGSRTFRQTFGHHHDLVDFEGYMATAFSEQTLRERLSTPGYQGWFMNNGEADVGYFTLRQTIPPNIDAKDSQQWVEIERFYLDQGFQGLGIGSVMMRTCLDKIRERGDSQIWLSVWQQNHTASKFYQKWGFTISGSHRWTGADCTDLDDIMVKIL